MKSKSTYWKEYEYRGELYTINQLEKHKDCKVTAQELRRNIWGKKLSVEDALVTPIPKAPNKTKYRYMYMGVMLSVSELSELPECVCSQWVLRTLLKKGVPVHYALKNIREPPLEKTPLVKIERKLPDNPAQGSQISFRPAFKREGKKHTYEWLCLERFGMVMEENGANVRKTIFKSLER